MERKKTHPKSIVEMGQNEFAVIFGSFLCFYFLNFFFDFWQQKMLRVACNKNHPKSAVEMGALAQMNFNLIFVHPFLCFYLGPERKILTKITRLW
jgi:hypothetical protein